MPKEIGNTTIPSSIDRIRNNGRENLELNVGDMRVSVLSVRSDCVTFDERTIIREARYAYEKWGGNSKLKSVLEDDFDNFDPSPAVPNYLTYHFIATLHDDSKKGMQKIVTMRMIHTLHEGAQVPDDFSIWLIRNNLTGSQITLDRYIREHPEVFRSRALPDTPMYPATISRLGTIDGKEAQSNPNRRIMTPVAFAAIQLAAGGVCQSNFIGAQLRPELKEKYLSVSDSEGQRVMLGFTHTLTTLGLDRSNKISLNNENATVQELKTHFPGYWLNEDQFRNFMFQCVNGGDIPIRSLMPSLKALLKNDSQRLSEDTMQLLQKCQREDASGFSPEEVSRILTLITDARFARYLVPLFNKRHVGTLKREEFQKRMVEQSGDGPYPVLMDVDQWVMSASNLLEVANQRSKNSNV